MQYNLLRNRWLYIGLFCVVVVLYARVFMTGSPMNTLAETKREAAAMAAAKKAPLPEMTLAEVQAAAGRHPRLGFLLIIWSVFSLGMALGGTVLTVRAWKHGRLQRALVYRSRLRHLWSLHDLGRLLMLLVMVFSLMPFVNLGLMAGGLMQLVDTRLWMLVAMMALESLLVLFVWGFASAQGLSLVKALGLSWHKAPRTIWQGVVTYVTVFPWVFGLLWLIGQFCQWFNIQPPVEPIQEFLLVERQPLIVGLTVLLSCVIGPIAEEIFFRGILFTALRRHSSRLIAMVVSASFFSAAHTNFIGFLPILILGCVLAYLYERTGSLWSPIVVHIAHNTFLVGFALIMKSLVGNG